MNLNIKVLTEQNSEQNKKIVKIETTVDDLKLKPAKHWEQIVATFITVIVSEIAGAWITLLLNHGG